MRLLLLFVVLVFSLEVYAQKPLKKAGLEKMIQPKVSLESSYLSDASIKGYNGSVAVTKNRLRINNKLVGFSYTNWLYNWNNLTQIPFGNGLQSPIKKMHSFKVNANLPYFINEKWFLLTSVSLKSTFEKETKDSYGAGLFSFASYKIDEQHTMQFGAFANYHPTSSLVLPVISYSYRARQNDGIKFILGFPRTYVGYHVDEDTLLRFGMIFSQSLIRLSDTSVIESAGFIEVKDYMSNFGISYDISKNLTIESDLLYSVKRNFSIYSKDGNKLNSYSIKASLGMNFKITYLF
ncbi:MAG: hypothetical protein ACI9TV_002244 [Sulfurimonas sp.]|jgi:hypothetical protein|uniref:hypothetical protein n=1 Tax=Sulfurimonas sp. TaxID=2022749 RepID=UPI0039E5F7A1